MLGKFVAAAADDDDEDADRVQRGLLANLHGLSPIIWQLPIVNLGTRWRFSIFEVFYFDFDLGTVKW